MDCSNTRKIIAEFIEGSSPPGQLVQIEEHLRSCEQCRLYAAELKKTIETVQGLDEIEPPADLTAKVMRKIRAEAPPQKSWIERFFFPLHIKLPIEAMATLLITVAAILVYKNMGPELRQMEVQQVQPQAPAIKSIPVEPEKEMLKQEMKQPERLRDERKQKEDARPADSVLNMETRAPALLKENKPVGQSVPAPAIAPTMPTPSSSFAPSPALSPAARQAETGKASGIAVREESVQRAAPVPAPPIQQHEAGKASGMAAREESMDRYAPAAPQAKLAAKKAADELATVTVMVKATDAARNDIETYIARNNGELKVVEQTGSRIIVTIKLDPARTDKFFGYLRSLGRMKEDKKDLAAESGFFKLVIEKE